MKVLRNSSRALASVGLVVLMTVSAACSMDATSDGSDEIADGEGQEKNMTNVSLVVRLEAKPGKEEEVAAFLKSGLPIVEDEPETIAWFGIRLGPTTFGIFDAFPSEEGRKAHLNGKVAAALMEKAPELLATPPVIEPADVLADKVQSDHVTVGLLVRLEAKAGKEEEVAAFLKSGLAIVRDEPATTSWFALRLGPTTFGIFDAFPSEDGREAHLNGGVASALMAKASELLSAAPVIEQVDVLAEKLPH